MVLDFGRISALHVIYNIALFTHLLCLYMYCMLCVKKERLHGHFNYHHSLDVNGYGNSRNEIYSICRKYFKLLYEHDNSSTRLTLPF